MASVYWRAGCVCLKVDKGEMKHFVTSDLRIPRGERTNFFRAPGEFAFEPYCWLVQSAVRCYMRSGTRKD